MHYFLGFFAVCLLAGSTLQGAETVAPKTKINPKTELCRLDGNQLATWITGQSSTEERQRALHFAADAFHEVFSLSDSLPADADVDPEKLLEKIIRSLLENYSREEANLQRALIMLLSAIKTESESEGLTSLSPRFKAALRSTLDTPTIGAWLSRFALLPQYKICMQLINDGTFTPIDPDSAPDSEASESPADMPAGSKPPRK